MALYTIADLHLSEAVDKPMDIFGGAWNNYTEKIRTNFNKTLCADDILVIIGDVSWGINLNEALSDFRFLSELPAKKWIVKGNHDLWWDTVTKMKRFLDQNGLKDIDFIYNNTLLYQNVALCGTRGWFYEEEHGCEHDKKIFRRELMRLETSLKAATISKAEQIYAFLHYPPLCRNYCCDEILALLKKYGVSKCYYGHLHGGSHRMAKEGMVDGIEFRLVAADAVNFTPVLVIP